MFTKSVKLSWAFIPSFPLLTPQSIWCIFLGLQNLVFLPSTSHPLLHYPLFIPQFFSSHPSSPHSSSDSLFLSHPTNEVWVLSLNIVNNGPCWPIFDLGLAWFTIPMLTNLPSHLRFFKWCNHIWNDQACHISSNQVVVCLRHKLPSCHSLILWNCYPSSLIWIRGVLYLTIACYNKRTCIWIILSILDRVYSLIQRWVPIIYILSYNISYAKVNS